VQNATGTVSGADVSNVSVTCVDDPPPTYTVDPPTGDPIANNQDIVFTFSEEVDPGTLYIDPEDSGLLLGGHTETWSSGNTVLTISPDPTWALGGSQGIVLTVEDLAGSEAYAVAVYDVINLSSVIHVDGASGSDSGTCGAIGSPCQTIVHGLSRAYNDGSGAVYVLEGTYDETRTCDGVETAVVMPPDVKLYGGFTSGFSLSARDPATYVTTIQANGSSSAPPPVQLTTFDDGCNGGGGDPAPTMDSVVDGFRLVNSAGPVAFFADEIGVLRGSEVQGDIELTGSTAVVGINRILGNITVSGGRPWILWNDIITSGTAVSVSGGNTTLAVVTGNAITLSGTNAIGVSISGGAEHDISDNDIDFSGATTAAYGIRDTTGWAFIDGNTIFGFNGAASGGWGISGGDDVTFNDIVLEGGAGDLYGIQGGAWTSLNTVTATGPSYGIADCSDITNNTVYTDGGVGILTASGTAAISNNTIYVTNNGGGIEVTAAATDHAVHDNTISVTRSGTTMTNGNFGIRMTSGAGGVIEDNRIGFPQIGVWLENDDEPTAVQNNVVTGRWGVVVTNSGGGTLSHALTNNTLLSRVGIYLDGGLDVDILNNVLVGADTAEHGIYVNEAGATPAAIDNNDIYDFPTVYRSANAGDCAVANECTLTEMEAAVAASGNVELDPVFAIPGGTDGDPTTGPFLQFDNYSLTGSSPCEVRQGGIDGTSWGYTDDMDDMPRSASTTCSPTNAGAEGWSMGAYEF
jgi:hypothetical protein